MVTTTVFSFSVGVVTGIYLGQNYNLPNKELILSI